MKVLATLTSVEATIDAHEQKRIVEAYLTNKFGIHNRRGCFHKIDQHGQLVLVVTHYGGSHSWNEESVVRVATPLDVAVVTVLDAVEKLP